MTPKHAAIFSNRQDFSELRTCSVLGIVHKACASRDPKVKAEDVGWDTSITADRIRFSIPEWCKC